MNENIAHIIQANSKDLGDGFFVRRSLPYRRQRLVGPFIFWDHMGPASIGPNKEMVVRSHPHIGISTITYLFSGEILHRDSLGNELFIRPNEVNWMTAGKGITHSERCQPESEMTLEGIQLWVALPKEHEDVDPNFSHFKEKDLPMIEKEGVQLRLIAGEAMGEKSPVPVFSKLFYLNGKGQSGASFKMDVTSEKQSAVYCVRGSIDLYGETLEPTTMGILKQGSSIEMTCSEETEFMILGGDVFPEERTIWWNFVSHDQAKIDAAKEMWQKEEFPKTIKETARIPLPEN
ncbi:MAG: pirin family protein [Pseudomonadota bacterium]